MGRGGAGGGDGGDVEAARAVDAPSDDQSASLLLNSQTAPRGSGYGTTDGAGQGHAHPVQYEDIYEEESTAAYLVRVAEPVVFWTVCTAVAAFACVNMIRMTKFDFPATAPEAYDGRSLQVGYVANSTEAAGLFSGCAAGVDADGAYLRDDVGEDGARFPDFIIAGARGGPVDELGKLMRDKKLACAAEQLENGFFTDPRWRAAPGGAAQGQTQ
jgi:hypothetical protein